MEWQPIETAPRDGTEVLLFQEGQRNVARWIQSAVGPVWCTPDAHALYRPSHWQPLPKPPEGKS